MEIARRMDRAVTIREGVPGSGLNAVAGFAGR
jgi:hypothetical protein